MTKKYENIGDEKDFLYRLKSIQYVVLSSQKHYYFNSLANSLIVERSK